MATTTIDYAGQVLTDVRRQIAVDDHVLAETKSRRNLVKRHARSFSGALTTFDSGSVEHGTVNKPASDADCGVVLDRRTYPELGPDGDDGPPDDIVHEMAAHVIVGVREEYPEATYKVCKRAILAESHEPIDDEQDPSVDVIVALTRADGDGRWIPNTEDHDWDASDPEEHTRLLKGPDIPTRVHRARVIRLGKAAVKQDATPVISSFNLEALALDHVDADYTIAEGLRDLLLGAADDLAAGPTRSSSPTGSRPRRRSCVRASLATPSRVPSMPRASSRRKMPWPRCTRTSSNPARVHASYRGRPTPSSASSSPPSSSSPFPFFRWLGHQNTPL